MTKIWRHCVSARANRKVYLYFKEKEMRFICNRVKIQNLQLVNFNPLKRKNICTRGSLDHPDLSSLDERLDYSCIIILLTKKFDAKARLTEISVNNLIGHWI